MDYLLEPAKVGASANNNDFNIVFCIGMLSDACVFVCAFVCVCVCARDIIIAPAASVCCVCCICM